jgi:hypothetical protein
MQHARTAYLFLQLNGIVRLQKRENMVMRNGKVQLPKHLQIFGNYKIYLFVSKNTI